MNIYNRLCILVLALSAFVLSSAQDNAVDAVSGASKMDATSGASKVERRVQENDRHADKPKYRFMDHFSIGGYGEAVMTRNFFSNNYLRYSQPELHKGEQYGVFDLPHVVINLGYDFGRGWSMGMEIEYEHGGTESAMEIEEEEGGEYESEIERGGEVALEQFWVQKIFNPYVAIRGGMIIIPVGGTNAYHEPDKFFGVYRPEGENTIIPCTWHEIGLSVWGSWGKKRDWHYNAMFLPGLDSDRFNSKGWIHGGSGSPYEYKLATAYAGALRIDNTSVKGLRLSLSGYVGNSFQNTLRQTKGTKYEKTRGTVYIGSFDFCYDDHNVIVRGSATYGHLDQSDLITAWNRTMRNDSPSPKEPVASDAYALGIEAGYDFFNFNSRLATLGQKFYVFARYDNYDSMYKMAANMTPDDWCGRQRIAAGINYFPMKQIAVKAEFAYGILKSKNSSIKYNNEPSISMGITYCGMFNKAKLEQWQRRKSERQRARAWQTEQEKK